MARQKPLQGKQDKIILKSTGYIIAKDPTWLLGQNAIADWHVDLDSVLDKISQIAEELAETNEQMGNLHIK